MRTLAAAALAVTGGLPWGKTAVALEEEQWLAGGQLAGALVRGPGGFDPGVGAGLEVQRGLTDLWAARAAVGLDAFRAPAQRWRRDLWLSLGTSAAFDVLRTVPFVDLGLVVALADLGGPEGGAARLGLQAGLGADYLIDRDWSFGALLRVRVLPLSLAGPDLGDGVALAASLRLARRF